MSWYVEGCQLLLLDLIKLTLNIDLISHPLALTFPVTLILFNNPRHLEIKSTDPAEPVCVSIL